MLILARRRRAFVMCLAYVLAVHAVAIARVSQTPQAPATVRVVRMASGPRGAEVAGQFRLEEERTTFSRARDTQVIVSFQWDGVPGTHRLAARWRSPNGGVSISEIEYTARDHIFGAYWSLPLTPSSPLGTWSLEATVDGLPSGTFTFEVVDGDRVPEAAPRPVLTPADLFARASSVFVTIVRSNLHGENLKSMAGFVYAPGRIATTFTAIDAADGLDVVLPGGQRESVSRVVAWNRSQDWALIPTATSSAPLPTAADTARVGDRCYSVERGTGTTRLLSECEIVGQGEASPSGGNRLVARFSSGTGIPGAPVLNEFGEVIGVVGGSPSPGSTRLFEVLGAREELRGVPIVATSLLRPPIGIDAVSLQELRGRGVLLAAVNGGNNIVGSGFAHEVQRDTHRPIDVKNEFSVRDQRFVAFLEWEPKERLRGTLVLRAYDDRSQVLMQSKPGKVDFKPGDGLRSSQWELSVPSQPGIYRVDVFLNEMPMWRGFFRVKP